MKRHILAGAIPPHWWERLKGAQVGLIVGLVFGVLLGWFFHGVISLAIRFGLLLVLLLPLIVIGWLWLRSQRAQAPSANQPQPPPGNGWTAVIDIEGTRPRSAREPEPPELVDVPFERSSRQSRPAAPSNSTDIEAELEALQRERQRERGA